MKRILSNMKQISGLAIFSFLLGLFWFTLPISLIYIKFLNSIPCNATVIGGLATVLLGVIALFYIKKRGLKGKLLAILGICLGILATLLVC